MSAVHVFFFRGLSTYAHDNAQWSIFDFGPVFKNFAMGLQKRGIVFHPITGMGSGSLPELKDRALNFLDQHPVWRDPTQPVHFLGHSAGGLIARLTLESVPNPQKVLSCLTIATPNQGSRLAQICIDMPSTHRVSARLLTSLGYDIGSKRHFFSELTKANVERVIPAAGTSLARKASIVCWSPRREWCAPLKLFYMIKAFNDFTLPSDGVVERDTQAFGDVLAELKVDHFRQAGYFGQRHRFDQMCDVAADFFKHEQGLRAPKFNALPDLDKPTLAARS